MFDYYMIINNIATIYVKQEQGTPFNIITLYSHWFTWTALHLQIFKSKPHFCFSKLLCVSRATQYSNSINVHLCVYFSQWWSSS